MLENLCTFFTPKELERLHNLREEINIGKRPENIDYKVGYPPLFSGIRISLEVAAITKSLETKPVSFSEELREFHYLLDDKILTDSRRRSTGGIGDCGVNLEIEGNILKIRRFLNGRGMLVTVNKVSDSKEPPVEEVHFYESSVITLARIDRNLPTPKFESSTDKNPEKASEIFERLKTLVNPYFKKLT